MPQKQVKRRRLGSSANIKNKAEHKNHVWSYDFLFDATQDSRQLKLMPVLDEYTRQSLEIKVERSLTSGDVIRTLARLFDQHGIPTYIRSDNGPEFIAQALRDWLGEIGVKTLFIAPGSPWENGHIESFNAKLRDELLNRESFGCLKEAKVLAEDFRVHYNTNRPHSALDYLAPDQFARAQTPLPATPVGVLSDISIHSVTGKPALLGSGI